MRKIILHIIILSFLGCQHPINKNENNSYQNIDQHIENKNKNDFITFVKIDTLYDKPSRFNQFFVGNKRNTDTLYTACSCDKNVKENSIKIQIMTAIPTRNELDTISLNSKFRTNRLNQLYSLDRNAPPFKGQLKYINIEMKDSIVKNINIVSRSSELEYNGKNFKKESINNYQIKISRFNYHNASKVYGNFKIILPDTFGLIKNDSIIRGSFLCMNWIINEEEDIKNWDLNKKLN